MPCLHICQLVFAQFCVQGRELEAVDSEFSMSEQHDGARKQQVPRNLAFVPNAMRCPSAQWRQSCLTVCTRCLVRSACAMLVTLYTHNNCQPEAYP